MSLILFAGIPDIPPAWSVLNKIKVGALVTFLQLSTFKFASCARVCVCVCVCVLKGLA
jgi:hypothetical protein